MGRLLARFSFLMQNSCKSYLAQKAMAMVGAAHIPDVSYGKLPVEAS